MLVTPIAKPLILTWRPKTKVHSHRYNLGTMMLRLYEIVLSLGYGNEACPLMSEQDERGNGSALLKGAKGEESSVG